MAIPLTFGYLCAGFEEAARSVRPGWRNRLLWFSSPEGGKSMLAAFAVVVMALSLVMSMSRSGMAAFALSALFVGGHLVMALRTWRTRIAAVSLFVVLIAVPVVWLGVESTAERFSSDSRGSLPMRLHVWSDTREIIRDFPLAGTGLNTFGTATVLYQTGARDVTFQEAHSDYLQLLAEGGILLGLPAAIAIVLLIRAVRRRFRDDTEHRTTYWIRFGAVSGLLAIALQSLVEFSLQMPGNAALCVVLVAVAMHETPVSAERSAALEAV
jgi:O-antigen ligase